MKTAPGTAPATADDRKQTALRIVTVLAVLGALFALLWNVLPIFRAALLPRARAGEWVLGPVFALRFAACTVLVSVSAPFLLRPFGKRWRARDLARRGAPLDPLAAMPETRAKTLIKGALLFVVYAVCSLFYFTAYTEVRAEQLVIHAPLGARAFTYGRVVAMERQAPVGGQPERFAMRFDDGSWGYFSQDCEGTSPAQIAEVASFISGRTGRPWNATQRR